MIGSGGGGCGHYRGMYSLPFCGSGKLKRDYGFLVSFPNLLIIIGKRLPNYME
jgi:hypothetical protein